MPFGKYKVYTLYKLPEPYLVWFKQKGFQKVNWEYSWKHFMKLNLTGWSTCFMNYIKTKTNLFDYFLSIILAKILCSKTPSGLTFTCSGITSTPFSTASTNVLA